MIRCSGLLSALLGCPVLAGCMAQAAPTPAAQTSQGRQCFNARQVNDFNGTKDGNVDIKVGADRYFRLDLSGACTYVDWARRVGIRATNGRAFICEGYDAELIVPDPAGPERCPVTGVHAITREQFRADSK